MFVVEIGLGEDFIVLDFSFGDKDVFFNVYVFLIMDIVCEKFWFVDVCVWNRIVDLRWVVVIIIYIYMSCSYYYC